MTPKSLLSVVLLICISWANAARESAFRDGRSNDASRYFDLDVVTVNSSCFSKYWPLLSLDGGGLRVIMAVEVLIEVETKLKDTLVKRQEAGKPITDQDLSKYKSGNEFEVDLADYFKAIAGVSTGSWIATYLASKGGHGASKRVFDDKLVIEKYGYIRPGSVEGLRVFFLHFGSRLYPQWSISVSAVPRWYRLPRVRIAGVNCPLHSVRGLEATLDLFLGQTHFSQSSNTTLMVHTYDLEQKTTVLYMSDKFNDEVQTYVFKNDREPRVGTKPRISSEVYTGKDYYMKDIARASSAAPTIYQAKKFTAVGDESFEFYAIDGSLMSNNPTLMATYFLLDPQHVDPDKHVLSILSIGTGVATGRYRRHGDSGAYQWFVQTSDFLAIMMDGGSEFVQIQFYMLYYMDLEPGDYDYTLPEEYLRIQTVYDQRTPEGEALADMYNPNALKELQQVAFITIERYKKAIHDFVTHYMLPEDCDVHA